MNAYIVFWGIIILFSFISFVLMSIKLVYKGFPELREMLDKLKNEKAPDE